MSAGIGILAAVLGLMGGVLSRSFPSWWAYLFVFVVVCVLLWRGRVRLMPFVALIAICAFVLGAWRMETLESQYGERIQALSIYEEREVSFEGVVVRDPEARETSQVLIVHVDQGDHRIRVSAPRGLAVSYGDRVAVAGELRRPEAFETEFSRMFPYEEYLRAHGITHTVPLADVEVLAHGEGYAVLNALFWLKHRFAESVAALLPEPHASFALGLLLGEKNGLGDSLESVFRTVGIIHIVVLSGYNLTIIAEALMRVLTPVLLPRPRVFVGALAIIAFALAVGPSATVVRATVMALLVLFARATGRTYEALRALLIAGACMVFLNPYTLAFDPGFQFSFLATLGLILIGPLVDRLIVWVPSYGGLREYASSTIATQIAVTPLLLWSIGAVSLIAVLANMLILIVVPLAMLLTFLAGLVGLLAPSLVLVAYPAYLALAYILTVAEFLAQIPFAQVIVSPFPFWIVALAYGALGALLLFVAKRKTAGEADVSPAVFSTLARSPQTAPQQPPN